MFFLNSFFLTCLLIFTGDEPGESWNINCLLKCSFILLLLELDRLFVDVVTIVLRLNFLGHNPEEDKRPGRSATPKKEAKIVDPMEDDESEESGVTYHSLK